jgi:hypothetical protein
MRSPAYGWTSNEAIQKPNPLATASISETNTGTKASRGFLSLDRLSSILPALRNRASVVHQAHALVQLVRVCVERCAS